MQRVAFVTLNCCCTSYLIILESRSNLEPESRVVQEEKNLALKQYLQYLQYHMHLPRAPPPRDFYGGALPPTISEFTA